MKKMTHLSKRVLITLILLLTTQTIIPAAVGYQTQLNDYFTRLKQGVRCLSQRKPCEPENTKAVLQAAGGILVLLGAGTLLYTQRGRIRRLLPIQQEIPVEPIITPEENKQPTEPVKLPEPQAEPIAQKTELTEQQRNILAAIQGESDESAKQKMKDIELAKAANETDLVMVKVLLDLGAKNRSFKKGSTLDYANQRQRELLRHHNPARAKIAQEIINLITAKGQ